MDLWQGEVLTSSLRTPAADAAGVPVPAQARTAARAETRKRARSTSARAAAGLADGDDAATGTAPERTEVAGGPAFDMAVSAAMLRRVARGESGAVLRTYRPQAPMVAFGRRDLRLPGFAKAVDVARDAGYVPVVRPTGGRVVACTRRTLVVDHVSPDGQWPSGLDTRFSDYGALWADALGRLGLDARVGEVPGEYCPGSSSVNARGRAKLVGTAQRMVRGAWLFSCVLMYDDDDEVRPLLGSLYAALDLPFDGASVGSVVSELGQRAPSVSLDLVEATLLSSYDGVERLSPADPDVGLVEEARRLEPEFRL